MNIFSGILLAVGSIIWLAALIIDVRNKARKLAIAYDAAMLCITLLHPCSASSACRSTEATSSYSALFLC